MFSALDDPEMDALLSRVSRSLYLSLTAMPESVRVPLSVGYLLARAADTLADTEVVRREQRCPLLLGLQEEIDARVHGPGISDTFAQRVRAELRSPLGLQPSDLLLLERMEKCLQLFEHLATDDRERVQRALTDNINGMANDLRRFDGRSLVALQTFEELDQHCYLVAGSFTRCFAELAVAHVPGVEHLADTKWLERAVSLGKAMQMVNILRDAPRDLRAGRCYLPLELLELNGLKLRDLRNTLRRRMAAPVFHALCELTLRYVDEAWAYVMALPATAPRLRVANVWAVWLGLMTLERIMATNDPLDATRVQKVPRRELYRMMAESMAVVSFDSMLERMHQQRRERVVHWLRVRARPATGAEPPRVRLETPPEVLPAVSP